MAACGSLRSGGCRLEADFFSMATLDLSATSLTQDREAAPGYGIASWSGAARIVLFWFALYGVMMPGDMIEDYQVAQGANFARDLFGNVLQASLWCLVSPLVLWVTRRYVVEGSRRLQAIGMHLLVGLPIAAGIDAAYYLSVHAVFGERIEAKIHWTLGQSVIASTPYMMILYLAFVAVVTSVQLMRRYEEREKLLAQAQVRALKAQLNPHFLYNTLNAVSEFAYKDAATAERLITMLSDLLRLSFAGGDAAKVPLADELAFVRRYLDIQQLLLEERLQVHYAIAPEALDAAVPNFILQPLVENAVVHGISRRAAVGHIEVGARVENGRLRLWVSDDGPGLFGASPRRHGIGLSHTRQRLTQLYGSEQALEIDSPEGGGYHARLCLPCEPRTPAAA
jgi:signal transduction histidine kinase